MSGEYHYESNGSLAKMLRAELERYSVSDTAAREKVLEAVTRLEESEAASNKIDGEKILRNRLEGARKKIKKIKSLVIDDDD